MEKFLISPTYSENAANTNKYLRNIKKVEFIIVLLF